MAQEHDRDSRPNPDPTERTIQQLLREIANVRELMQTEIKALADKLTTRLDGMEKLYNEKFEFINEQFTQRDDNLKTTLQSSEKSVAEVKEGFRRDIEGLRVEVSTLRSFQERSMGGLGTNAGG